MEIGNATSSFFDPAFKNSVQVMGEPPEAEKNEDTASDAPSPADTISVSRDALLLTEALRTAQNTPDVRMDKVEAIRAKLAGGTYEIDAKRIAASLIREDPGLFKI